MSLNYVTTLLENQARQLTEERLQMLKSEEPRVGTIVQLKVSCLENEEGVSGICYDVYEIGERKGYAFIFENGRYDGFAPDEVERFLKVLDHYGNSRYFWTYKFTNVIALDRDFKNGAFDEPFSEAQILKEEIIRSAIAKPSRRPLDPEDVLIGEFHEAGLFLREELDRLEM